MRHQIRLILVLFLCLLPTIQATQAQDDHLVRYPMVTEPDNLNPFTNSTIVNNTIIRNLFRGLTETDLSTGDIIPSIADSWIVRTLEDGRQVFTFNLRQDLRYHQLEGVTLSQPTVSAQDILWNYKLGLNPNQDISARGSSLRFIEGAEAYQAAFEGLGDDAPHVLDDVALSGVTVIDDLTVEITLVAADRLFLIDGMIAIVSPEAYQQLGTDFDRMPVGLGHYQFEEWIEDERIVLVPNPNYLDPTLPRNDGVIFQFYEDELAALDAYRASEVDVLPTFPTDERDAIIQEFNDEFFDREGLHVRYWGFNMADGFLRDKPLLRQALSHTLDRETAWLELAQGARLPAHLGLLPPAMPASMPACTYDYDLDRAADLLDDAGYSNGDGLPTLRIYALEAIADEPQVALWLETLDSIGIDTEIIIEDGTTYWDSIETDNAMIFQTGWSTGIIDPTTVFDFLILDGNGSMRYNNPIINDLLREARIELNLDARTVLYQEVHDTIMCEAVVIPSAYSRISWLQQPWIEGFEPGGGGTHTAPLWEVVINR